MTNFVLFRFFVGLPEKKMQRTRLSKAIVNFGASTLCTWKKTKKTRAIRERYLSMSQSFFSFSIFVSLFSSFSSSPLAFSFFSSHFLLLSLLFFFSFSPFLKPENIYHIRPTTQLIVEEKARSKCTSEAKKERKKDLFFSIYFWSQNTFYC